MEKAAQTLIHFLFGAPHPGMSTFFLFAVLTIVVGCLTCRKNFWRQIKFVVIYTIFIIVAHHLDLMIIDNLAPAKDSTRTFVIILLSARLLRELFEYIQMCGVQVPAILQMKVKKMEDYPYDLADDQWHPSKIDEQIALTKEKLRKMEQYAQIAKQLEKLEGREM
jgi:phage-related holin